MTHPETTFDPEEMELRTAHGIAAAHEFATRKRLNDYLTKRRNNECRIKCDRILESDAPVFVKFLARMVRP